jgi:hypothetical protein
VARQGAPVAGDGARGGSRRGLAEAFAVAGRVVVVGGLLRLDAHYRERHDGLDVDTIYTDGASLERRLPGALGVVLVDGMISHPAMRKVRKVARREHVPSVHEVRAQIDRLVRAAQTSASAADPNARAQRTDTHAHAKRPRRAA